MTPVGLLLVDKPEGPTSHDVVDRVRRGTGVRRVGHTGTLDPFASGLLLLCVGWATRLAEYLTALPKTYRGVVRLGERTDTDDRTGKLIGTSEAWRTMDAEQVRAALDGQLGEIEQLPPAYSAKKLAGRRAYELARRGGRPELQPERVMIRRLTLCDFSPPYATVEIECSSGTYVRSVARDVGETLGVGAHLCALRRLRIGEFDVADALKLEALEAAGAMQARIRPPEDAVAHLRTAHLSEEAGAALRQGRCVEWEEETESPVVAVIVKRSLVAIAEPREGRLWPKKVFSG